MTENTEDGAGLTGMQAVRSKIKIVELARRLGITRGAIQQWTRVPAERIGEVAEHTGLDPSVIRPDLIRTKADGSE